MIIYLHDFTYIFDQEILLKLLILNFRIMTFQYFFTLYFKNLENVNI